MFVLPCVIHYLGGLRLGDLVAEDAAHAHTTLVHIQHDGRRLTAGHAEETLQHIHDEFHWRVIIIEHDDLVH